VTEADRFELLFAQAGSGASAAGQGGLSMTSQLSAKRAGVVKELAAVATVADGVAPLSEDVLLQIGHGSVPPARDVVVELGNRPGSRTMVGYAHMAAPDYPGQDGDVTCELVVHPAHRRRGYGKVLLAGLTTQAEGHGVRIWAHGDLPGSAALARGAGFTRIRALYQMRMPLAEVPVSGTPVLPAGISLRTFERGDEGTWLRVNSRAFAHHPEQGSWTLQDLLLRKAEPWFDPEGFFLAEREGRLVGFHWTKVHPDGGANGEPIGEVYVVGVDPDEQGSGLGRALTLTGLDHLKRMGLAEVMLYVDESNTAAVAMYTKLGFRLWSTDVMYRHS
jgi:mycothiol synthase